VIVQKCLRIIYDPVCFTQHNVLERYFTQAFWPQVNLLHRTNDLDIYTRRIKKYKTNSVLVDLWFSGVVEKMATDPTPPVILCCSSVKRFHHIALFMGLSSFHKCPEKLARFRPSLTLAPPPPPPPHTHKESNAPLYISVCRHLCSFQIHLSEAYPPPNPP
jgi:hypothetical protein